MTITTILIFNSFLLGIGLAMDAFSVSLANGLNEPKMKFGRMSMIAGTFGIFQGVMPLIGWFCVRKLAEKFVVFQNFIPWIALVLLLFIGGKMLMEGIQDDKKARKGESDEEVSHKEVGFGTLAVQGIATSIDALSVGFTIADYNTAAALVAALIIAAVTFVICLGGLALGRKFGTILAGKASILGGVILIGIGLEIWITGVFM